MIGKVQTLAITGVATFLIGTFGGGYLVHKLWLGKSAIEENARLEARVESATESARIAREGQEVTKDINDTLRATLGSLTGSMTSIAQANTALAESRAPRVQTIYREAETFANDTFDPDSCPRLPVDDRLLDFIWPPTPSAATLRLAGPAGPT